MTRLRIVFFLEAYLKIWDHREQTEDRNEMELFKKMYFVKDVF